MRTNQKRKIIHRKHSDMDKASVFCIINPIQLANNEPSEAININYKIRLNSVLFIEFRNGDTTSIAESHFVVAV